jgi:hypothetical protein
MISQVRWQEAYEYSRSKELLARAGLNFLDLVECAHDNKHIARLFSKPLTGIHLFIEILFPLSVAYG